jgi:predicted ATPase with chaperone activity
MAPADLRKEGAAYDVPIALVILVASGQVVPQALDQWVIMGELSLDGSLRPVRGALLWHCKPRLMVLRVSWCLLIMDRKQL